MIIYSRAAAAAATAEEVRSRMGVYVRTRSCVCLYLRGFIACCKVVASSSQVTRIPPFSKALFCPTNVSSFTGFRNNERHLATARVQPQFGIIQNNSDPLNKTTGGSRLLISELKGPLVDFAQMRIARRFFAVVSELAHEFLKSEFRVG